MAGFAAGAGSAQAQIPPPPYCYVVGRTIDIDVAGFAKNLNRDGQFDTWLRLYIRNMYYYLGQGDGRRFRSMVLRSRWEPDQRWDTIPYSNFPTLVVTRNIAGQILNDNRGSIDGQIIQTTELLDLFVADNGPLGYRKAGFELVMTTWDGTLTIPVAPVNVYDVNWF